MTNMRYADVRVITMILIKST